MIALKSWEQKFWLALLLISLAGPLACIEDGCYNGRLFFPFFVFVAFLLACCVKEFYKS